MNRLIDLRKLVENFDELRGGPLDNLTLEEKKALAQWLYHDETSDPAFDSAKEKVAEFYDMVELKDYPEGQTFRNWILDQLSDYDKYDLDMISGENIPEEKDPHAGKDQLNLSLGDTSLEKVKKKIEKKVKADKKKVNTPKNLDLFKKN